MLGIGGAAVSLVGFRRGPRPITAVAGAPAREVGRSYDARFFSRVMAVAAAALTAPRWLGALRDADVLIARNLEMLALARVVRALSPRRPGLVYETLDIHRFLVAAGPIGRVLRWIERRLARPVRRLIVSSPAFLQNYYAPRRQLDAPAMLLENKVLNDSGAPQPRPLCAPRPPWRIAWFGMIRCRRSLSLLKGLCEALPDLVEVEIRGRVAETEFDDFAGVVAATPNMRYLGPYDQDELPQAYGGAHFAWAIDFFEAGWNSDWLLPNRLYEGLWHGAIPLAQAQVETGRWLARNEVGVTFSDLDEALLDFFSALSPARMQELMDQRRRLDPAVLAYSKADCVDVVGQLGAISIRP